MMKLGMAFAAIIALLLLVSSVYAIPGTWKGYVTVDGASASEGTFVSGFVDSVQKQNKTTGDPLTAPDNYYVLDLPGSSGQSVTFKVYGVNVNEAAQTWEGSIHNFNLTMTPSSSGGNCTYGQTWSNNGCASSLTCCSDNTCKSSCTTSSSSSSSSSGGGGGGAAAASCTEDWTCEEWSECIGGGVGIQTRTCTDQNECGTTELKPEEERSCEETITEGSEPAVESAESRSPSRPGTTVGEVSTSDGVLWKWSGTTWVKEGTPEYDQIETSSGDMITGKVTGADVVQLGMPLIGAILIAALIIYMVVRRRRRK